MKNRLWIVCIIQTILFACAAIIISYPAPLALNPDNISLALMSCLASVSVFTVFLYIFKLMKDQSSLENAAAAFRIYTSSLERQNDLVSKNEEKAALFRQEVRDITQMMQACAVNGDMHGIAELIKLLDSNSDAEATVRSLTGHKLLDTMLNSYIRIADEAGIEISVDVTGVKSIQFDPTELAAALSNVLENAVSACKKQQPDEKRSILVNGIRKGKQYFWQITNTFSGDIMISTKNALPISDEVHGTGFESIAYFAEKYGAELFYYTENNLIHMMMLIHEDTNNTEAATHNKWRNLGSGSY